MTKKDNMQGKIDGLVDRTFEAIFGNNFEIDMEKYLKSREDKLKEVETRDLFIVQELMKMKDISDSVLKSREGKEITDIDEKLLIERHQTIRYMCIRILYIFGIDLYDE